MWAFQSPRVIQQRPLWTTAEELNQGHDPDADYVDNILVKMWYHPEVI